MKDNRSTILSQIYFVVTGIVLYVSGIVYFGTKNDLSVSFLVAIGAFGVVVQLLHIMVLCIELQECLEKDAISKRLNRVNMCNRECTCPKCKVLRRKSFH